MDFMTRLFYINLDRVPERAKCMEDQLAELQLLDAVERIPALDAAEQGPLEELGYAPHGWLPRWTIAKTLVCGFLSHRQVWQRIVDQELPAAVVMEDDLFFSADFPSALGTLENHLDQFDVVKLDGADYQRRYGPAIEFNSLEMRPILQEVPSAAAYLLTQAAARRLVEISEQFADHIDDFIFRPRESWRSFQLFPSVALQGMFCSEQKTAEFSWLVAKSERSSDPALNSDIKKGPLSYRVSKEIIRTISKTQRRLWGDRSLVGNGGFIGRPTLADDLRPYKSEATQAGD